MSEFTREVIFYPAFDKRNPDPHKNYGIHGVDLRFILKKDNMAVQFIVYTNWHLPHVSKENINRLNSPQDIELFWMPIPADLGYHSPYPMYDGQSIHKGCEYIGQDCYYDGSSLMADDVFKILLKEGSDGVWRRLEEYWNSRFSKEVDNV